jgi:hypothetical protein
LHKGGIHHIALLMVYVPKQTELELVCLQVGAIAIGAEIRLVDEAKGVLRGGMIEVVTEDEFKVSS